MSLLACWLSRSKLETCSSGSFVPGPRLGAHGVRLVTSSKFLSMMQELTSFLVCAGQQGARPDWVHIFLAALPLLPFHAASAEAAIAAALAQAAVAIMRRHGGLFRHAAVAEWEVRLRVRDLHDPWRIIVSTPTGKSAMDWFQSW